MRRELCAVRAAWATRMGEVRGTGVLPPSRRLRQAQVAGAVLWAHSPMFTDIHLYSLIFTEIHPIRAKNKKIARTARAITCLLYTSDAADDLLCVDLGGRRII